MASPAPFSLYSNNVGAGAADAFGPNVGNRQVYVGSAGGKATSSGGGALPKRPVSAGHKRPQSAGRVGKLKNAVAHAKPEDEDHFASMPRYFIVG
jgi:hypothetical protein